MKAAFYTPYLDTLGGGEKYLFDIALVLMKQGYECVILWKDGSIINRIIERFGQEFSALKIDTSWDTRNAFSRIVFTRSFDVIFFDSDGSYFLSLARKNFVVLQAPSQSLLPRDNWWNRLKFQRFIPVYYDNFVKRFFAKNIGSRLQYVLNPTISHEFFTQNKIKKEKIILSVGRFFSHLHSKKQEILIKAFLFAQEKYSEFRDYKLVLAGSFQEADRAYLKYIMQCQAGNSNIILRLNLSHTDLLSLYQKATFYWHAAGYGENSTTHPEKMEHFGISVVESMASGCIPIVYNGGGPKEIVLHGKNGYTYNSRSDLIKYTQKLMKDETLIQSMSQKSRVRAAEKYSDRLFTQNVLRMVQ